MKIKKSFPESNFTTLDIPKIIVVIDKGIKEVNGVEYNMVEKMLFYSKKSFLTRLPSLLKEIKTNFKIKQRINNKWQYVDKVE